MEGADETSINTNLPIYTWEVGMRREADIKGKGGNKEGRKKKRNTGTFCNQIYNST